MFLLSARAATSRAESRGGNRAAAAEMQIIALSGQQNFLEGQELFNSPLKAVIWGKAELRGTQAMLGHGKGILAVLIVLPLKAHLQWEQCFGEKVGCEILIIALLIILI